MLEAQVRRRPVDQTNVYGHSRSRTGSSNNFPLQDQSHGVQAPTHLAQPGHNLQHSRRSASVNTFSTSSSIPPPAAYRKSSASDLRRSTSSRSGGTVGGNGGGNSYVALLRKQKATVWCDRAQYEDPRLAAQHRAAKMRANAEVVGGRGQSTLGPNAGRSNTGISATTKVAAKVRHRGKAPLVGLTPGENHVGVGGVPLRLSATEVEAESSEEDDAQVTSRLHHRRTGSSGRSSTASGRRQLAYRTSVGHGSMSSRQRWSPGDTPDRTGSLVEDPQAEKPTQDDATSVKARSTASGSSAERADNVAELGNAPRVASNSLLHSALTREKSVKNPEELKRRGSVDERTATLTSQRLYIANPD